MKKYLFFALALLGMASCAKDDLGNGNKPNHNGEVEESYIAINLMAADSDTRADETYGEDYGLEYGTADERKVSSAHFFFFKDGEPFTVNQTNDAATAPGGTQNHLQLAITNNTSNSSEPAQNISDISKAVLVLKTYKGEYPNQIVAVLNWTPESKSYELNDLLSTIQEKSLGNNEQGYVMSNSVYMNNANEPVYVTPITADNIKTEETAALNTPVDIYVERTAAKVIVTNTKATDNRYQVTEDNGFTPVGAEARNVYVELLGWELYNEFENTNLLKNIENWDPATLGLTWNDSPYFRSYWAKTMNSRSSSSNDKFSWEYTQDTGVSTFGGGFPTQYGYAVASSVDYTNTNTYTYCGENTLQTETNADGKITSDPRTKVILKGRLVEEKNGSYEVLELARWYGNEYAGEEALKTAVVNSLKYTLLYRTGDNTDSAICVDDIVCVKGEDIDDAVPGTVVDIFVGQDQFQIIVRQFLEISHRQKQFLSEKSEQHRRMGRVARVQQHRGPAAPLP